MGQGFSTYLLPGVEKKGASPGRLQLLPTLCQDRGIIGVWKVTALTLPYKSFVSSLLRVLTILTIHKTKPGADLRPTAQDGTEWQRGAAEWRRGRPRSSGQKAQSIQPFQRAHNGASPLSPLAMAYFPLPMPTQLAA